MTGSTDTGILHLSYGQIEESIEIRDGMRVRRQPMASHAFVFISLLGPR